jgi:hypothetical protein
MPTELIGRAAPQLVHACTIQNQCRDNVYVRVLYEPVRSSGDQVHERRVEFQLGQRGQTMIDEEGFDMGSFQIREAIRTVEVTRPNGRMQEIHAPFDNVHGVELDWLFVIDESNIRSMPRNAH